MPDPSSPERPAADPAAVALSEARDRLSQADGLDLAERATVLEDVAGALDRALAATR